MFFELFKKSFLKEKVSSMLFFLEEIRTISSKTKEVKKDSRLPRSLKEGILEAGKKEIRLINQPTPKPLFSYDKRMEF